MLCLLRFYVLTYLSCLLFDQFCLMCSSLLSQFSCFSYFSLLTLSKRKPENFPGKFFSSKQIGSFWFFFFLDFIEIVMLGFVRCECSFSFYFWWWLIAGEGFGFFFA